MHPVLLIIVYFHSYVPFFFNDTATTEIYTLSLHDALPIFAEQHPEIWAAFGVASGGIMADKYPFDHIKNLPVLVIHGDKDEDRKSTRLNSSHVEISYAVFCLKKKKKLNECSSLVTNTTIRY